MYGDLEYVNTIFNTPPEDIEWIINRYWAFASDHSQIVRNGWFGDYLEENSGTVIFEGAQGVLLDETKGISAPHVTWTDTTTNNALSIIEQSGSPLPVKKLGVVWCYMTRHGAGPFPSEDAWLTEQLPDRHNGVGQWQGAFRVGWFDVDAVKYAIDATGGVDALTITCLDRIDNFEYGYNVFTNGKVRRAADSDDGFVSFIESEFGIPVAITSYGPTHQDKYMLKGL